MKNIIKTAGKNTVEAEVAVYLIKQGDYYVSFCPALDLSSFGDTEKEAKKGFETALAIFLKETRKRSTLEKVLLDLGWKLQKLPVAKYTPPASSSMRSLITKQYPLMSSSKKINERVDIPVH